MLSYSRGPATDLLDAGIDEVFRQTAARFPDALALVVRHDSLRLTYRELDEEVERTARGLTGLGLKKGDRVGMWASNCAEWIYLQLGCARTGIILVNVNPAYRSHELAFVLGKSHMRALFLREQDARANYRQILEEAQGTAEFEHAIYLGTESWRSMIAGGREAAPDGLHPDDVTNIQYTSGTTGSPKGVLLTHRNLINNGHLIARALQITEQDRICVPVPMYHCFGCVIGTMVAITTGAALIMPSVQFDALATLKAVEEERATAIYGVPTMFIAQLCHPEFANFDLRSLRTGVMAGSPCPIEIMKQVIEKMHCRQMTIGYGQTEASPIITMSSVEDSVEVRVGTVGRALPETEVKIVSPVTGETLPVGEQGELCSRGYLVMKGYDDEPEATRKAIDDEGWLHTGDLSMMRPDGCFRITGRSKDMIIRGGENIYPREIEEFLYTHPKIADVQVTGLPDARLGETVLAWIRLKPGESGTEDEIRDFCKGRIAHFKIPQYIRFVDSFPMTVTGKIQKYKIRQQEIRERGLEDAARIQTA
jgi:fatty-acyl-CoA synthase